MILKLITFLCALCLQLGLQAEEQKVYIFTYAFNRPDFIEIQYKTFKKFLKDDYEYIVFNDATDVSKRNEIESMCASLGVTCINIPQYIHSLPYLKRFPGEDKNSASVRNCNVVQYSLDTLGFNHNGYVALFDSDLFLVKDFSIKDFLKNYELAGLSQCRKNDNKRVDYLWIGLVFMNFAKMPNPKTINFNCGKIEGLSVDSGGFTYYYLKDNPTARVHYFDYSCWPFATCEECSNKTDVICLHNHDQLVQMGFDENQIDFIHTGYAKNSEMFEKKTFFHYRAGTNWNNQTPEYHKKKTEALNNYINAILAND